MIARILDCAKIEVTRIAWAGSRNAIMTRNSKTDWGWPAKTLHWVGAAMILILIVHGWWMTHMTPRPERLANYAWHAALGYDLFVILIPRLLWRWLNPSPELPVGLQPWERVAARLSHAGLYRLLRPPRPHRNVQPPAVLLWESPEQRRR